MRNELEIGRAWSLSICASLLLAKASETLKKDDAFYKQKNKQLLNQLIESNNGVLRANDRLKNLIDAPQFTQEVKEANNEDALEVGDLSLNLTLEQEVMSRFMFLFVTSTNSTIHNLDLVLSNLSQNRRLYTQEEVDYLIKQKEKQYAEI